MSTSRNIIEVIINGKNQALPAFQQATRMMVQFGAVSTAALTAATIRAGKFERQMAEISTLLDGDVEPQIESMAREVRNLSVLFGQAIGKMAKARYDVISAGFTDGAESAIVLEQASKLAVAGVSDVATSADILTTALNAMGEGADYAATASDILLQTVRKGKTTLPELAQYMGKIFSSAKLAGVGMEELGAVMATVTASGVPTAEAVTGLNGLLMALAKPSEEAGKMLDQMGINLDNGLVPALEALGRVGEDGLKALGELVPQIEALRAAGPASSNIGVLKENLRAMAESAGVTDEAFAKMSDTFDFKLDQAKSAVDSLTIVIGNELLPTFSNMVSTVTTTAMLVAFLAETTEDGERRWKGYWEQLEATIGPATAVGRVIAFVKDQIALLNEQADKKAFNKLVTAEMKRMQEAGEVQMQGWWPDTDPATLNLAELRQHAEDNVRVMLALGKASEDALDVEDEAEVAVSSFDAIRLVIEQAIKDMLALRDATAETGKATEKVATDVGTASSPKKKDRGGSTDDYVAQVALYEDLASLAQFTRDDWVNTALTVGDAFGSMVGHMTSQMIGLAEGPIMIGRAFRAMGVMVIDTLARIITQMLVAKVLMSIFNPFAAAASPIGFIPGITGVIPGMSTGGRIPSASTGMALPAMVMPGHPGIDGTLVRAHGGEVMVPRQTVDAIDRSRRAARTEPAKATRRSNRNREAANIQLLRPLRREEQNLLWDSVDEAENRAKRHRG